MAGHLDQTSGQNAAPGTGTPLPARLAIFGGVAAALGGAVYLMAVRGEALLVDLSSLAGRVWCF
jgi:hypothetical protein